MAKKKIAFKSSLKQYFHLLKSFYLPGYGSVSTKRYTLGLLLICLKAGEGSFGSYVACERWERTNDVPWGRISHVGTWTWEETMS